MHKSFGLFALGIAAVSSLYLAVLVYPKEQKNINHPEDPNAYGKNITFVEMDQSGQPNKRLEAQIWKHYLKNNTIKITSPKLTLYSEKHPNAPWQATASQAISLYGMKRIELSDNVILQQINPHDNNQPTYLFKTQELTVKPKEKTMFSNTVSHAELNGIHATTNTMKLSWETGLVNFEGFNGVNHDEN